jgi:hypothetical protein
MASVRVASGQDVRSSPALGSIDLRLHWKRSPAHTILQSIIGTDVAMGHLDADCFYVSAERVRFAELRGMSVGVLGYQGACVIAKSYEMKSHGV